MCHAFAARRRAFSGHGFGEESGPWGREGFMPPFAGEEGFGVRRPLRFLAHKLDLDEKQIVQLARILDELKTERAQAAVDERRTLAEFADALGSEQFDGAKASAARDRRGESNRRVNETVVKSLEKIHAILNAEQRERLGHLIRTGILVV
jgi:Spy/CpxP family protein refolding chaperone